MLESKRIALVALAMLVAFAAALPGASARQATPAPAADAPRSTAILVSATNAPLRVAGSDGSDHLEYDLLVTNAFVGPVALTEIEVFAADGESLLRLDGDALTQATQPLIGRAPTEQIPASGTVAVVMDVVVPPERAVERLTHRIAYEIAPDAPGRAMIGSFAIERPELEVDPRPATVIAPPLRGDGWLAANSCCSPLSLHRSIRVAVDGASVANPEVFAIDWVLLRDGRLFAGDGSQREQWFGFGAEVYAVANGTVVSVREGMPEEAPLQPVEDIHEPGDYGGNQVFIEIAPGVYAFYAHLQPGSIAVEVGDTVTAGQQIARLGNTGNSDAPHLHFGLLDAPAIAGNSLPMVFDRWTLTGRVSPEAFFGAFSDPGEADVAPERARRADRHAPAFPDRRRFRLNRPHRCGRRGLSCAGAGVVRQAGARAQSRRPRHRRCAVRVWFTRVDTIRRNAHVPPSPTNARLARRSPPLPSLRAGWGCRSRRGRRLGSPARHGRPSCRRATAGRNDRDHRRPAISVFPLGDPRRRPRRR